MMILVGKSLPHQRIQSYIATMPMSLFLLWIVPIKLLSNGHLKKFNITEEKLKTLNNGVNVGDKWPEIYEYFSRCLVKSSAESRASGAGAGLVDND